MLKSIKEKLRAIEAERNAKISDNDDSENLGIMECARFIQELDDLSIKGTPLNDRRSVDVLDIRFDDVELESVEISANDGRILDIPADILVHSESYEGMKSFEDFFTEAYSSTDRNYSEPEEVHNNKVRSVAITEYKSYLSHIFQEGLFSAGKVKLSDPTVQWSRMINFGPSDPSDPASNPYIVRLNILYQSKDHKHILVKQRDTVAMMIDPYPDTFKNFGAKYIEELDKKGFTIPAGKTVWDVIVPKAILIPIQPVDQFIFFIDAENVLSTNSETDHLYIGYSLPISAVKNNGISNTSLSIIDPKSMDIFLNDKNFNNVVSQKELIRESVTPKEKPVIGRMIQEGIDFGGESENSNNDTPPAPDAGGETGTDDTVTGDSNSGTDSTETSDSTSADNNNAEDNKPASDVSDQIAEKVVEDEKNADAEGETTNEDLNTEPTDIPEDDSFTDNPEINDESEPTTDDASVDDQLNALDAEATIDNEINGSDVDLSNKSMNDLIQLAENKLKNMPIADIQAFINDDTSNSDTGVEENIEEPVTEAFIITRKNINAELDASLRKSLGDLNDSTMNINELVGAFKRDGKKLNRALSKAAKMTDIYDESERNSFIKLNKCLADLLVIIKANADKKELQTIKRLIKAFVQQAAGVGKIIEKHKNDKIDDNAKKAPTPAKKSIGRSIE